MELSYKYGNFDDAKKVRTCVFVEEQGFQGEFDDIDHKPETIHITLYVDGELAGCSRIFPSPEKDPESNCWIFGRLAVLKPLRGKQLGTALLNESEAAARKLGATEMHLHAQCRAVPFYAHSGYKKYGPIELDEHVEHIWMSKTL